MGTSGVHAEIGEGRNCSTQNRKERGKVVVREGDDGVSDVGEKYQSLYEEGYERKNQEGIVRNGLKKIEFECRRRRKKREVYKRNTEKGGESE